MNVQIRPMTEADYPAVVALNNSVRHTPQTVEDKARFVQTWNAADPVVHLVAEHDAQVVGYGLIYMASWVMPGCASVQVTVDAGHRGMGVGSALYAALEAFVAEHRPRGLVATVHDNEPASLSWAERRGFAVRHHFFESVQQLDQPLTFQFTGQVERLQAAGYRFVRLSELLTPEAERRLYEFHHELLRQTPNGADTATATFEDWRQWALKQPAACPEGSLIAMDSAGRWVGFTLLKRPTPQRCLISFTGVVADCRGQGLALGLKLAAMDLMRAAGVREVATMNHSANGPMLAINRKLGYVALPGHYQMYKPL